jgi:hypothetical protein
MVGVGREEEGEEEGESALRRRRMMEYSHDPYTVGSLSLPLH